MAKEAKKVRVRLKTCLAGSGFVLNTGDLYDTTPEEADRLIKAGFAAAVDGEAAEQPNKPTGRRSGHHRGEQPRHHRPGSAPGRSSHDPGA